MPQMTVHRMVIAWWIPRATNTHSVCVIRIASPLHQWLLECTSVLCYTYIACLVNFILYKCYWCTSPAC